MRYSTVLYCTYCRMIANSSQPTARPCGGRYSAAAAPLWPRCRRWRSERPTCTVQRGPGLPDMDPDDPEDAAALAAAKAEAEAAAEQLFVQFDADGSGSLDTGEVRRLRPLVATAPPASPAHDFCRPLAHCHSPCACGPSISLATGVHARLNVVGQVKLLLESQGLCVTDAYLDGLLQAFDEDGNGEFDRGEFAKLAKVQRRARPLLSLRAVAPPVGPPCADSGRTNFVPIMPARHVALCATGGDLALRRRRERHRLGVVLAWAALPLPPAGGGGRRR
jgi:hypothetical protein